MLCGIAWTALSAFVASASAVPSKFSLDPSAYLENDVIYRDVVVIGGGSSGTYTAVRLKDRGKSVVVIEKKGCLGGHGETYVAPGGQSINYGAVVFNPVKIVKDYLARLNIQWYIGIPGGPLKFIDFANGKASNFHLPDYAVIGQAFDAYLAQLAKYPGLKTGYDLPDPVPDDLLLTYQKFIEKYNISSMVYTSFMHQGLVPLLDTPMLYVFKYIDAYLIESQKSGYIQLRDGDTQALYRAALSVLGEKNVLLNSVPMHMHRSASDCVKVVVDTHNGIKLVVAKKLVSAIPPTLDILEAYDLSDTEQKLFAKWSTSNYYAGVLNNTGLDNNFTYFFAQPREPFAVPRLPGPYMYGRTEVDGHKIMQYGSPTAMSVEQVKEDAMQSLLRMQMENGLPQTEPGWAAFSDHSPFNFQVSPEEIKAGFYKELYALNGQKNTFYNGGTFQGWSSTNLWEFTEAYLLPLILDALQ